MSTEQQRIPEGICQSPQEDTVTTHPARRGATSEGASMSEHDPEGCADWRALARFEGKVTITGTCWLWAGAIYGNGYGSFHNEHGRREQAHRWAYRQFVGPLPEGLQVDHLCRVRNCVNPDHLEAVTPRENTVRQFRANGLDDHCRNGHPRTPGNVHVRPDGSRYCRECKRQRDRNSYDPTRERQRKQRRKESA